jgi:uncharacterized membrane protein
MRGEKRMESRAKLFGHPIHQMLVVFPLGLLAMAVVFDVIGLASGTGRWSEIAYWMISAGILSGFLAAPFGFIDWLAIPAGTRAKRVGAVHGVGNLFVLVLFAMSWAIRGTEPANPGIGYLFSFAGGLIALVTGWLGGELVVRLSVGVDEGAHLDAPSSLSTRIRA